VTQLGDLIRRAREQRGWTLRDVEAATGVHNAHLSQIEKGHITSPSMALLWSLAEVYEELDFHHLLDLAGHTTTDSAKVGHRSLQGVALAAVGDLTPQEEQEILAFLKQLRRRRASQEDEAR
jgi:transcriptional regulator with XRE-family HTH domain